MCCHLFSNGNLSLRCAAPLQHSHTNANSTHLPATSRTQFPPRLRFLDRQPTTMAATRKATGPAPSQANASAKNSDAADISGYTELHARAEILVAADTKLKQVVEKIRPHPTKLECASAFDPIRDLARDLDAQIDERVPQLALRQILHQKLAPVGDSRCLEGWTWKELKDRDVSAAAESLLATVRRERVIPACSSSSVSAKKYPCVNLHRREPPLLLQQRPRRNAKPSCSSLMTTKTRTKTQQATKTSPPLVEPPGRRRTRSDAAAKVVASHSMIARQLNI
mmetsp:Transcript_13342/g.27942  ORF Transcript_13342/g.27942 Transcript_13342/m.27942 type:complete len:281 (-) Transcript_13342:1106-1948(-)